MPKFESQPLSVLKREALLHTFGNNDFFQHQKTRLELLLKHRFDLTAGLEKAQNLVVVDLGCGSPQGSTTDAHTPRMFEAWFPRVCAVYGTSKVIGVDLYPQDPVDADTYTHITTNLVEKLIEDNGLSKIVNKPEGSVDIITTWGLFGAIAPSRAFAISLGIDPNEINPYQPTLKLQTGDYLLRLNLFDQAQSLLKPEGVLQIDLDFWKKTSGELRPIPRLSETLLATIK